jgi:RNA polymerase sigma-70 factor (ECF subfamily)
MHADRQRPGHEQDQAHDETIGRIWATHEAAVVRYAAHLLEGDIHLAQDVAQDTALQLWRHPEVPAQPGSIRGWLLTVARNNVIDRSRRRDRRPAETALTARALAAGPTAEDHAELVAAEVTWNAVLRVLDVRQRAAIELVYLQGLSVARAAARLGVPEGTIKSRCHLGLKRLRQHIRVSDIPLSESQEHPRAAGTPAPGRQLRAGH